MVRVVMKMEKKENRRAVAAGHTAYEKGEAAAASKMMAKAERNVAKAEQKMAKAAAKVARVGQKMAKAAAEEEKAGQTGPLAEAAAAPATVEPSAAHSCIKKSSSAASDAVIIDVGPSAAASRVCTLPQPSSYPSYPLISVVRNLQAQPSPPPVNIMAAKGYAVFLPDGPNVDITDVSTCVFDKIFVLPSVPDPVPFLFDPGIRNRFFPDPKPIFLRA